MKNSEFSPPTDEHQPPGQHRDAELSPSTALHQDLPGSPRAAGVSGLPEPPEAGPPHLDLQPQRHPNGPRRQGAPLHGLSSHKAAAARPGLEPDLDLRLGDC